MCHGLASTEIPAAVLGDLWGAVPELLWGSAALWEELHPQLLWGQQEAVGEATTRALG